MNCGKSRREYLKTEIQRCEGELISLINYPEKYCAKLTHVKYLKSWYRVKSLKEVDNSVEVYADVIELV